MGQLPDRARQRRFRLNCTREARHFHFHAAKLRYNRPCFEAPRSIHNFFFLLENTKPSISLAFTFST